jgi:hypothetical protein
MGISCSVTFLLFPPNLNAHSSASLSVLRRGIGVNMIAVAIPIAITIFVTDILKGFKHKDWQKKES